MSTDQIFIIKASGKIVPFSREKIVASLRRSRADNKNADTIANTVVRSLREGMTTKSISRIAFGLLKNESGNIAGRYRLKTSIIEQSPSGFPFEQSIGELLKQQRYSVRTGELANGNCVKHEIEVIAEKENRHCMIECKYHNMPGTFSDVKIPLYIQSGFKDVETAWLRLTGHKNKQHEGWVVTNTRFCKGAIQYGTCVGLFLLDWDYPKKHNLRDQIDLLGLYPVTCLNTLMAVEKKKLLRLNTVLCKDLFKNQELLRTIGIKASRIESILQELCNKLVSRGNH